jgi:succinate dehydrogenase/fumarate reductase-like Fe-S protein
MEDINPMADMVNVYFFGKKYEVPSNLTIMTAMEYAGYQLVRGVGCRNGFCGACATIYRIKGQQELKMALACQTQVENNMYVATLPFFPLVKQVYDINKVKPEQQLMMQLYPEIYACVGCNACTKACTQGLNVMQYIAYAQRGDFKACADLSFDCVMCGVCSSRCPAGISHPQVAMLARRLNGKYLTPQAQHLLDRVKEISEGKYDDAMKAVMSLSDADIREKYNTREIEK